MKYFVFVLIICSAVIFIDTIELTAHLYNISLVIPRLIKIATIGTAGIVAIIFTFDSIPKRYPTIILILGLLSMIANTIYIFYAANLIFGFVCILLTLFYIPVFIYVFKNKKSETKENFQQ